MGKHGPIIRKYVEEHLDEVSAHCAPDVFESYVTAVNLGELELAKPPIGFVYRTLGAGTWALRQGRFQGGFREVITEIVRRGGDADTNAAVAGALFGTFIGLSGLPKDWLDQLCHRDWLAVWAGHYADLVVAQNNERARGDEALARKLHDEETRQIQEERERREMQTRPARPTRAKLQWMWGDAQVLPGFGALAKLNPQRWSELYSPERLADALDAHQHSKRPVLLRESGGSARKFANPRVTAAWLREDGVLK